MPFAEEVITKKEFLFELIPGGRDLLKTAVRMKTQLEKELLGGERKCKG
jgi:hypothetical protein